MLRKRKKRTSGERSVQAIWTKSRSCAGRRNRGLGDLPNKHETADFRASGKTAVFASWGP